MTWDDFSVRYDRLSRRKIMLQAALLIAILALLFVSPMFGQYSLSFSEVYSTIVDKLLGAEVTRKMEQVVWNIRIPVAITAVIVGFALAMCGAVMQTLLRNPLADPYTMGISSGASLGASLYIVLGISVIPGLTGNVSMVANAFLLSLIPSAIVVVISVFRKMTPTAIILSGVAVMYIFSSITSLMMLVADPTQLSDVYIWNLGTVGKGTWSNLPYLAIPVIICLAYLLCIHRKLDVVSTSDELAHSMGVNPNRTRIVTMVVISLTVASVVCITGTIGFVGLVAPHIARLFCGTGCKNLCISSGLVGALLLLGSECIARSLGGLPVGVITSLVGCPLFIVLLIRQRKSNWV